jgi:hypothetical protein
MDTEPTQSSRRPRLEEITFVGMAMGLALFTVALFYLTALLLADITCPLP